MIKKYNDFISEEKKFRTGPPSPDNPKCSFVDIDKNDITTYARIFKKLTDEDLITLVGNRAWYFKGDIDTKSILTDDEHRAIGHDEENESVKITEEFELPDMPSDDCIICPYCQKEQEEHPENIMSGGGGLGDEFAEWTCDDCGENFDCSKVVEVKYYTRKK